VTPEGQIYGQNLKFQQFWGLYSHISAPINVEFGMRKRLSGQCVAPAGQNKPFLDHWGKTIPTWLCYAQACR